MIKYANDQFSGQDKVSFPNMRRAQILNRFNIFVSRPSVCGDSSTAIHHYNHSQLSVMYVSKPRELTNFNPVHEMT